jgi:microcystin-dependent protein
MPRSPLSRELTVPTGCIEPFAGDIANLPPGFLYCDGSIVSRAQYAKLFEKIGTTWGQGDGSTTFHLPDLRGRFLRGTSDGSGRDPNAGARTASNAGGNTGNNVGSIQADQIQGHRHATDNSLGTNSASGGSSGVWGSGPATIMNFAIPGTPINLSGSGSVRYGSETRPINTNVNYIIKT